MSRKTLPRRSICEKRILVLSMLVLFIMVSFGCNQLAQIAITPATANVAVGQSQQFAAVVRQPDKEVIWEVLEGNLWGTITENGLYTAPAELPFPPIATVVVSRVADPLAIATAKVTIVTIDCAVASVNKIIEEGVTNDPEAGPCFPRWSTANNLLTYSKEKNNQYEIYIMNPDGSNVKCITCDENFTAKYRLSDFGVGHRGQSSWSPDGNYIVFTGEVRALRGKQAGSARAGGGRNHNIWIARLEYSSGEIDIEKTNFTKLTDYERGILGGVPEWGSNWGAIEPYFSNFTHNGKYYLHWSEEYSMEKYPEGSQKKVRRKFCETSGIPPSESHPGCYWSPIAQGNCGRPGEELCAFRAIYAIITLGDFPVLSNYTQLAPLSGYIGIETTGFSPDDTQIVGSFANVGANPAPNSGIFYQIYSMKLSDRSMTPLVPDTFVACEDTRFSPDGTLFAFKAIDTSQGLSHSEIWMRKADLTEPPVQLTHFNDPGYPEYDPNSWQNSELTWNPDGTSIIVSHISSATYNQRSQNLPGVLYEIKFTGNCGYKDF